MNPSDLTPERIEQITAGVAKYLLGEREVYLPHSKPLAADWKDGIHGFFSAELLERLRTVTLNGARIPPPPFYAEAVAMSGGRFPDFVHMASFTYLDVIVFHERIEARALFHAAVHAAQMAILGFEEYVRLYVLGFVKNFSWLAIPLEDQAYKLDARYAAKPNETFSVEEEVRLWLREGTYG